MEKRQKRIKWICPKCGKSTNFRIKPENICWDCYLEKEQGKSKVQEPSPELLDKCPVCEHVQYNEHENKGDMPYITDGDIFQCSNCGFSAHADWWLDFEAECHLLRERAKHDTEKTGE